MLSGFTTLCLNIDCLFLLGLRVYCTSVFVVPSPQKVLLPKKLAVCSIILITRLEAETEKEPRNQCREDRMLAGIILHYKTTRSYHITIL